jgi:signal peptidase I
MRVSLQSALATLRHRCQPRPRPWRWCLLPLVLLVIQTSLLQVSVVRGHSMEPNLHDGDRLVVDKVSMAFVDAGIGDVVVMRSPSNPGLDYVKRIVALPGDQVAMRRGVLYRNGVPAESCQCIPDLDQMPPVEVPAGHYFVLGDNRPVSSDSREFGLVPAALLKGKVCLRFWPLQAASLF